jgi:hypothetical protein
MKPINKFYLFGVYWPICKDCKLKETRELESSVRPELEENDITNIMG